MIDKVEIKTDEQTKKLLLEIQKGLEDAINESLEGYHFKDNMKTLSDSLEKIKELSEVKEDAKKEFQDFRIEQKSKFDDIHKLLEEANKDLDAICTKQKTLENKIDVVLQKINKPWYKKIFTKTTQEG